jgi:2,4-dienoyl-CoA reductase-like NADH-dependent reductase (Old Yellow Enzyme family)
VPGGWDVEETVLVSKQLAGRGVDLIDVSSGGLSPEQKITVGPGYQVPFAAAVREGSGLPVAAVGMITEPEQAEQILADGRADAVLLARALLRDPSWPQRAAFALDDENVHWPVQYQRARWRNRTHAGQR